MPAVAPAAVLAKLAENLRYLARGICDALLCCAFCTVLIFTTAGDVSSISRVKSGSCAEAERETTIRRTNAECRLITEFAPN